MQREIKTLEEEIAELEEIANKSHDVVRNDRLKQAISIIKKLQNALEITNEEKFRYMNLHESASQHLRSLGAVQQ